MRWLVEITDITNERLFFDLLASGSVRLFLEENRIYLISDKFERLSTCFEVWTQASQTCSIISEISSGLHASISFKLGTVYEQKEDGSRHGTVFRSGVAPVLRLSTNDGEWAVTPEISEEERLRLEAEQLERKYQEKLALVSSRLVPALQDEHALKVHRFLQQELNPLRMGHIMELIEADLGAGLKSLASNNGLGNKLSRFSRSINHPEVFGDESRHITSNKEPPANPMSLSEAQFFVARIADLWFKQKCIADKNV